MFSKTLKNKKKSHNKSAKKDSSFSSPPVILWQLLVINYASFYCPPIFESLVDLGLKKLSKIEPQINSVLLNYNQLLTREYSEKYQFQQEMVQLHKKNTCVNKVIFQSFFNHQFNFENLYQFISEKKKKNNNLFFKKNFQQIYICTNSGLKVYLLADKALSIIWVIFRGTDEIQNMSVNLSAELQQIGKANLSLIRLLLNKPELGYSLGDCQNKYISQIFRLLSEGIHSIFNGILYLSQHVLKSKTPAHIYVTGLSLGGQLASIFSLMYPRIYSSIHPQYQQLISFRSYCFPLSSPKVFHESSCNQMLQYLHDNQIAWMRYFTEGDNSRQILLKSKGWYYPELNKIETAYSYSPRTLLGKWIFRVSESKIPITIFQLVDSIVGPHQDLFGCQLRSLIHPCFFLPPFLMIQVYQYLNKNDTFISEKDSPLFDILIQKLVNQKREKLLTIQTISDFWKKFLGKKFILNQQPHNLKICTQIYNYLHGFPKSRQVNLEIFQSLNPEIYKDSQLDIYSIYTMMEIDIIGIKGSPLFRDLIYYLISKGLETKQQFEMMIIFNNKSRKIRHRFSQLMKYNTDFIMADPVFFRAVMKSQGLWECQISSSRIDVYQDQHLYSQNIDIHRLINHQRKTLIDSYCQ